MKFLYEYRTSDNAKHSGEICAADREAAYAALKRQGIKPSRFAEAPGVFNKLFGKGKRWIAIGVLVIVAAVFAALAHRSKQEAASTDAVFDSPVRRQIIGDQAIIEKGILTGWSDIFSTEGDRFLASFAIPGVVPAIRTTTEENLRDALHCTTAPLDGNTSSIETRQVVAIVSGMKEEICGLLKNGWTLSDVGKALVNRQEKEISYYERAKAEVESAKARGLEDAAIVALWENRNASLRRLGIRLISLPDADEKN